MKNLKKIGALLLALVMTFSLSVAAFADAQTYTITIDNAKTGETYTAYKIFDVTYNDANNNGIIETGEAISYTISTSSEWFDTVAAYADISYVPASDKAASYSGNGLTLAQSAGDPTVYVVSGTSKNSEGVETRLSGPDFAAALDAAKAGKTGTSPVIADGASVNIVVTEAGYYFVDTTLGALCSLDTTTPNVTIKEKNIAPSITKTVQEDDTGVYGESAVLDVIDTVNYKLTVNTGDNTGVGATVTGVDGDYKIEDTLPAGFTYNDNSIEVKVGEGDAWNNPTDYTVSFENQKLTVILLATGALKSQAQKTDIIITYTARMDSSVDYTYATGNVNSVVLTYKAQSAPDSAVVYTYQLGGTTAEGKPIIQKVDGTDPDNKTPLAGVKFTLQQGSDTGKYAKMAELKDDDNNVTGYVLTDWVDAIPDTSGTGDIYEIVTGSDGGIVVKGLDEGTYILSETETLLGYNQLNDTITAVIASNGTVTYKMTNSTEEAQNTITIENKTGSLLPSTGGMGTTLFYVVGGVLVIGAAVLLITRRRMNGGK